MKERKRIEQQRRKMGIFNEKHQEMSECMFVCVCQRERERERERRGRMAFFNKHRTL